MKDRKPQTKAEKLIEEIATRLISSNEKMLENSKNSSFQKLFLDSESKQREEVMIEILRDDLKIPIYESPTNIVEHNEKLHELINIEMEKKSQLEKESKEIIKASLKRERKLKQQLEAQKERTEFAN